MSVRVVLPASAPSGRLLCRSTSQDLSQQILTSVLDDVDPEASEPSFRAGRRRARA